MNWVIRLLLAGLLFGGVCIIASADDPASQLPKSLIAYERPSFPAVLAGTSVVDGYTTVAIVIRADGGIDDAVVLEASHPGFGESVMDVMPTWRFERAISAEVLPRREVFRFEFKQGGAVASLSHRDAAKAAFPSAQSERMPIRTLAWAQLTIPPRRLSAVTPTIKSSASGKVAVSYIIDTSGRVRVPLVVEATRPELGLAALTAVKQWQFSPPTHEGTPVLVEDRRSFTFGKN